MTTIKQRLLKVQAAVVQEKANGGGPKGELIGLAAEKAMRDGINSEAWKDYMALFADSADQMARLTTDTLDGTNTWLPRARAYIIANAVCTPDTDAATIKGISGLGDIDAKKPNGQPLDETPDPVIVARRPVQIP